MTAKEIRELKEQLRTSVLIRAAQYCFTETYRTRAVVVCALTEACGYNGSDPVIVEAKYTEANINPHPKYNDGIDVAFHETGMKPIVAEWKSHPDWMTVSQCVFSFQAGEEAKIILLPDHHLDLFRLLSGMVMSLDFMQRHSHTLFPDKKNAPLYLDKLHDRIEGFARQCQRKIAKDGMDQTLKRSPFSSAITEYRI